MKPELLFRAQICTKSFVGWGFALYANKRAHRSRGKGNERTEGPRDGVVQRKEGRREGREFAPAGYSRSVDFVDSSVSYNKIYSYCYHILRGQFSFLFQLFYFAFASCHNNVNFMYR